MQLSRTGVLRVAPWALLGLFAAGIATWRIGPLTAGQVGYDTAASVLYLQRLVAGQQLEAFVAATPKALLTLVDGGLFELTHDWRSISLLAVVIYGLDVALGAALAARLAGPLAAGFAAVGLIGSVPLLDDAAYAYAVGPAVLCWLIAALALTARRPRYPVAGVALMLGTLARFETVLFAVPIVLLLAGAWLGWWGAKRGAVTGAWWLLLILASLPLQALHDVLLTGDPLWFLRVSAIVSEAGPVASLPDVARTMVRHYTAMAPLVILALIGVLRLFADRRWGILAGILVLGPGILAFLLFLAARETYISYRYYYPTDITLVFMAALGIAQVRIPIVRRTVDRSAAWLARHVGHAPRLRHLAITVGGVLAGGLVAYLLVRPFAPRDATLVARTNQNHELFTNLTAVLPTLRTAADQVSGIRDIPSDAAPTKRPADASILVPLLLQPRVAVELGVPVTSVGGTVGSQLGTDGSYPHPGQLVYHDPRNDQPPEAFRFLEVESPTDVGAIRLVPLHADPDARVWLIRIEDGS